MEFSTTSKVSPEKSVALSDMGIQLFEAKTKYILKNIDIPTNLSDEIMYEKAISQISKKFDQKNYCLVGNFLHRAVPNDEFRERYERMSAYEKQCYEMEQRISKLKKKEEKSKKCLENIKTEKDKQIKETKAEKEKYEEYRRKNEYYQKLEEDNSELKKDNSELKKDNSKWKEDNDILKESNRILKKIKRICMMIMLSCDQKASFG